MVLISSKGHTSLFQLLFEVNSMRFLRCVHQNVRSILYDSGSAQRLTVYIWFVVLTTICPVHL
jgi:hypothetical protein